MSRLVAIVLLLACLAVAGCAGSNDRDSDRFGGFYGGINGGGGVSR